MAKYKVLRPIEHHSKLYLPANWPRPPKVISAGHGGEIPVDTGGIIELSPEENAGMTLGQVEPLPSKSDKQAGQAAEDDKTSGRK